MYIKKEVKSKPGPKPGEPGKIYRVWLKPSFANKIISKYGRINKGLIALYELQNKKDEKSKN
jgi:hypothetical protein